MFRNQLRQISPLRILALAGLLAMGGFASSGRAASAVPELHSFTNESGASFKGQILSVAGDEVSIKREDGQTFRPKVAVFSKKDQAYIRDWLVKNATARGGNVFSIKAASSKGIPTTNISEQHYSITAWTEFYQLGVKNQTSANWGPLHVKYIIFKKSANFGKLPPEDFTLERYPGTQEIDKLAANEEKNFSLEKIGMQGSSMVANTVWGNGAPRAVEDKLWGIWVRVYDEDDNLLQEWASDPDIMKTERWPVPAAAGQRRGARAGAPPTGAPSPRGTGGGRGPTFQP